MASKAMRKHRDRTDRRLHEKLTRAGWVMTTKSMDADDPEFPGEPVWTKKSLGGLIRLWPQSMAKDDVKRRRR